MIEYEYSEEARQLAEILIYDARIKDEEMRLQEIQKLAAEIQRACDNWFSTRNVTREN